MSSDSRFRQYVAQAGIELAEANASDLRLAWDCQQHEPQALAELDRRIRAALKGA